MFALLPIVTLALSAATSVSAVVVPRRDPPPGWAYGYLEDYTTYHTRYLALNCQDKHGQPFFDQCCHPLLATENLKDNRPAQCTPSASASSSAHEAEPTSTVKTPEDDEDDDEDCEDEDDDDSEDSSDDSHATSTEVQQKVAATTAKPDTEPTKSKETEKETKTEDKAPAKTPDSQPSDNKGDDNKGDNSGSDSGDNSGSGEVVTGGFATFYQQNGVAGACGDVHGDGDLIAAIDSRRYGDTGKKSDLCGKKVHITNTRNGKSVTVSIEDACPTCKNNNSIDLSEGAFKQIDDLSTGMTEIKWQFV